MSVKVAVFQKFVRFKQAFLSVDSTWNIGVWAVKFTSFSQCLLDQNIRLTLGNSPKQ